MEIKQVRIDELKEHPKNPRVHPDSALDKLVRSIKEYGWTNPVLVSKDGYVLAGHARCKAAQKAGLEEVPVVFLDLEGERADAYLIADNKIQEETDWDLPKLADLLSELDNSMFDVSLTGFEAAEIDELFSEVHDKDVQDDEFDADEALGEIENPVSQQGDIWLLGKHRLICGDSTNPETYEKLMDGKQANLVVTDLPYNVDYEGAAGKIKNDNMGDKEFYEFLFKAYKNMFENMVDGAPIYVFHADRETVNFRTALKDAGFFCHQTCIWVKNSPVLGRSDYLYAHEPILYGWKPTAGHKFYADRKQRTVWNFDRPTSSKLHPTTKPLPLLAYPIKNSSLANCIVLDPFGGSGSTLISCDQINRVCYMVELDEKFVDVIVKRYIEHVGTDKEVFILRDDEKIPYEELQTAVL